MLLKNILPQDFDFEINNDISKIDISSVEIDSRKVVANSLFFALKGAKFDGCEFIEAAIKNGAVAIVCDSETNIRGDILRKALFIKTSRIHDFLVEVLKRFYSDLPSNIFAITGTNGKTSVAEFLRQIFTILGKKSASIGTLGVNCDDLSLKKKMSENSLTTPDLVSLYKNLAILKEYDTDFVALEASSIGLEQGRVDGIKFKVGAFTNFTQDHLDYHKDMESYFRAKMILFNRILPTNSLAILNSDEERFNEIGKIAANRDLRIVSYGKNKSDFWIKSNQHFTDYQQVKLQYLGEEYSFKISFLEDFQLFNVVCALALVQSFLQLTKEEFWNLLQNLYKLTAASGRMERVATLKNKARVYIDFAHTPDALINVLRTARSLTKSRVLILFGCGGDRDSKKRPIMGKIACDMADLVIVSDDNPRTENAANIRKEIMAGIVDLQKVIEVENRKNAIGKAISLLQDNDILVIAGKGHESYQIIGQDYFPFDERKIVNEFID